MENIIHLSTNGKWLYRMRNKDVQEVVIPQGVERIDDYTFEFCSSLRYIDIPNSVTSIGEFAFQCCDSLVNIDLPNSIISIYKFAFTGCI